VVQCSREYALHQARLGQRLYHAAQSQSQSCPQAKGNGQWIRIDQLTLQANTATEIYLESVDFPLVLVKQVFANGDGSTGIQYLVSSDMTLSGEVMTIIYRKRTKSP